MKEHNIQIKFLTDIRSTAYYFQYIEQHLVTLFNTTKKHDGGSSHHPWGSPCQEQMAFSSCLQAEAWSSTLARSICTPLRPRLRLCQTTCLGPNFFWDHLEEFVNQIEPVYVAGDFTPPPLTEAFVVSSYETSRCWTCRRYPLLEHPTPFTAPGPKAMTVLTIMRGSTSTWPSLLFTLSEQVR